MGLINLLAMTYLLPNQEDIFPQKNCIFLHLNNPEQSSKICAM